MNIYYKYMYKENNFLTKTFSYNIKVSFFLSNFLLFIFLFCYICKPFKKVTFKIR